MDDTIAVAPRQFHQLYIVHGQVNGIFIPLANALRQRKTQIIYEEMFHALQESDCDPSSVMVDFELSVDLLCIMSLVNNSLEFLQFCFEANVGSDKEEDPENLHGSTSQAVASV